ncbi:MAG: bifunctional UDP-sugar hydrolase/5'-nucleotidase [Bacteroidales bacterium]
MKKNTCFLRLLVPFILFFLSACGAEQKDTLTIIETTDLHGVILPYDFIESRDLTASLAGIATYVNRLRAEKGEVLLLDDGDNLQGQPEVYYYNFIDTVSPHFGAEAMNWLGYDAASVGNHDIETGHPVYDRLTAKYNFALLAANAVDTRTGKPYFKPYTVVEKKGFRIVVLGLITPEVPTWLPPELYSGMEFRDMEETARQWMPAMKAEKPDLIVGLFHSGWDDRIHKNGKGDEPGSSGSAEVARNVPGFDIILNGHDHRTVNEKIVNSEGDTVLILDAGSRGEKLARADIIFSGGADGTKVKSFRGRIVDIDGMKPDPQFMEKFSPAGDIIKEYVGRTIATSEATISSRDAYFGPSPFVDMIHRIQLDITKADVSFAAPLSFDVSIRKGPVTVGDMFKLYRFENMLYTMSLTGAEIKKYLEFSYAEWLNTMTRPGDYLLKYRLDKKGKVDRSAGAAWLRNQPYNFDSAAGIDYTVDARKPEGKRITIRSFSDGRPFEMNKSYTVALNSYRGSGGGGHLTAGAGIKTGKLAGRLISSTDRDLRYYMLKYLEEKGTVKPVALNNWKIIPEGWVKNARSREYRMLFGK